MSGIRGIARKGKIRATATVQFADTGKIVKTHIFIKNGALAIEVVEKLARKFDKDHTVLNVRKRGSYGYMFAAPVKVAA